MSQDQKKQEQSGAELARKHWDAIWSLSLTQLMMFNLTWAVMPLERMFVAPLQKLFYNFLEAAKMGSRAIIACYLGWLASVLISIVLLVTDPLDDPSIGWKLVGLFVVLPWVLYIMKRIIWNGIGACVARDVRRLKWGPGYIIGGLLIAFLIISFNHSQIGQDVGQTFGGSLREMVLETTPSFVAKVGLTALSKVSPALCPEHEVTTLAVITHDGREPNGMDFLGLFSTAAVRCLSDAVRASAPK